MQINSCIVARVCERFIARTLLSVDCGARACQTEPNCWRAGDHQINKQTRKYSLTPERSSLDTTMTIGSIASVQLPFRLAFRAGSSSVYPQTNKQTPCSTLTQQCNRYFATGE